MQLTPKAAQSTKISIDINTEISPIADIVIASMCENKTFGDCLCQ